MKGVFQALHARTLSHATENADKVKQAFVQAIGVSEVKSSKTEGHHGNEILVLEATISDDESIREFFERMAKSDLEEVVSTLRTRIDDGCNLFIRLDKQAAFEGNVRLARNDDVISVRLRIRAFPAKPELAEEKARAYLDSVLGTKS